MSLQRLGTSQLQPMSTWFRFDLGDLWTDFEEIDQSDLTLMTKSMPQIGDVWVSKNGNTLYVYAGVETQTIGGEARDVDVVEMYQTSNLQPEGGAVYEQCFQTGLSQQSTDNASLEQFSHETVNLDSAARIFHACQDRDPILVQQCSDW